MDMVRFPLRQISMQQTSPVAVPDSSILPWALASASVDSVHASDPLGTLSSFDLKNNVRKNLRKEDPLFFLNYRVNWLMKKKSLSQNNPLLSAQKAQIYRR